MKKQLNELFISNWKKYFPEAGLPIAFFYTNKVTEEDLEDTVNEYRCLICNLNRVREGHTFVYSAKTSGCLGGKRYTGFSHKLRSNFEYFLSCGIPGKVEGERYKKSPDLVRAYLENNPPFEAHAKYLVFKRWDRLAAEEEPLVVIFFAVPDVLSGLFTLANYDVSDPNGVIAPMGSGCSSIVSYPLAESKSNNPRCVLGMFDVSARPCVPEATFTFTVPMRRFIDMIQNMDGSFLITESWNVVKTRINRQERN